MKICKCRGYSNDESAEICNSCFGDEFNHMIRKINMKPWLKYRVITVALVLFIMIGLAGCGIINTDSYGQVDENNNIKELSFSYSVKDIINLKVGDKYSNGYLTAKVRKTSDFSQDDVVFISDNPDIATISLTKTVLSTNIYFEINAINPGETYVYAKSKDGNVISSKIKVIVSATGDSANRDNSNNTDNNIKELSFSSSVKNGITLSVGEKYSSGYINAKVKSSLNFSQDDVIFVSDNPEVATISLKSSSFSTTLYYEIVAVGPGETRVYVTSKDGSVISNKINIFVPTPIMVETISINGVESDLALGDIINLTAEIKPENAEDKSISWQSSDSNVATIDQKGKLTAVGGGSSTITATSSNGIVSELVVKVDGSKRVMDLKVSHPRQDNVNIGSEWSYNINVNGEHTKNNYTVSVGDKIEFYAKFIESDEKPDVGEASTSYTVRESDLKNGFTVTMDLYVTENGGRNSGKSAHFVVTFVFTP